MTRTRIWQDVGREIPLDVGGEYDLPDPVAAALVATGAAVRVDEPEIVAIPLAPENAALSGAPESGHRRRRAS